MKNSKFTEININTYKGGIPENSELVIAEAGNVHHSALTLYGFDEIGEFDDQFKKPIYGFITYKK